MVVRSLWRSGADGVVRGRTEIFATGPRSRG